MDLLRITFIVFCNLVSTHAALAAENLAMRQKLAVLQRSVKRSKFQPRDRLFWVWLVLLCGHRRAAMAEERRCRGGANLYKQSAYRIRRIPRGWYETGEAVSPDGAHRQAADPL